MDNCCAAQLRLIRQIHKWIGANPKDKITVPKTLIEPPDKGMLGAVLDWITPDNREITSLVDLLFWINEQNINSMGQWGQTLEIPGEVASSTQGDQVELKPGKIYIPDIATALIQIIMLLLNLQDDEPQLKDLAIKNLL